MEATGSVKESASKEAEEPEKGSFSFEENLKCSTLVNQNADPTINGDASTEVELWSSPETCSNDSQIDQDSDHSINHCLDSKLLKPRVKKLNCLKRENKKLKAENDRLEKEIAKLEADRCPELHELQLETLEKTIVQHKQEVQRCQDAIKQQNEMFQKQIMQSKQEYESKIDRLTKQYELARKEKESMVMKYAVSEKSVIDLKREIQSYDNKIKEAIKDKEANQVKLKIIFAEKTKISQQLEAKNFEIASLERENSRKKDEISMRDSKIKWSQNRLKSEVDSHAETQGKLEKLQQKLNEVKEEAEQYKKQTQALIKSYQEAQEDKTNQEQEQKAKLIIDKYDEESAAKLQVELDSLKKRQQNLMEENNFYNIKVQNLEKERYEQEQTISKMKESMDSQKQIIFDLQSQVAELESISKLLQQERDRVAKCQREMESLRLDKIEALHEAESCRNREAELLEFTQKLTEKNVQLQTEFTAIDAKLRQLNIEHGSCINQIQQLTNENSHMKDALEREKSQRREEHDLLAKHLEEQTKKTESLVQDVADLQGENQLLKKKHLVTIKELTKELQVCRKKLENYENSQVPLFADRSRTSSNTSLNIMDSGSENKNISSQASPTIVLPTPVEPDRQVLIDKIVKIQKLNARKTEKIEFLEEHIRQLVTELQKKTRIIQNYIIREQSGALSSETMDHNKLALSKHGGIMASVYNSKAVDEGMTLELSLEINKKLQAVLEDTLLKNITLKENMETLGNEIAKLISAPNNKQSQIES